MFDFHKLLLYKLVGEFKVFILYNEFFKLVINKSIELFFVDIIFEMSKELKLSGIYLFHSYDPFNLLDEFFKLNRFVSL